MRGGSIATSLNHIINIHLHLTQMMMGKQRMKWEICDDNTNEQASHAQSFPWDIDS